MNHVEIAAIMTQIAPVVRDYVAGSVSPLLGRIDALEKQLTEFRRIESETLPTLVSGEVAKAMSAVVLPKDGEPGRDGAPGRDGVDGAEGPKGEQGPSGESIVGPPGPQGERGIDGAPGADGASGLNGKDADPELILKMVTEAVAGIPVPKDGRDGKDADPEAIGALVAETVAKAVSALPVAKDGAPGKDGAEGLPGRDGRDGLPGIQGEKGIDGKNGIDGTNGIDGMGFDDLGVDYDGERTFTLIFSKGERVQKFPMTLPVPIYRGVYKPGTQYQRGDMVTFGGSTHVAETDTEDRPESGSKAWRLCVKRGRDGQDGILKEPPKPKIVKV